jgi:DNA polymerase III subunit delta'
MVVSFSTIVGHQRIVTLLSQAIARDTLPPTLLLAGPAGVGKFVIARAVAAALNCTNPQTTSALLPVDACGKCRSCERVARGVHVDVTTVEPDERASIKIDVVREVLERTAYRPFEGKRRAIIIRDADALEPAAQNAMLKSLEEPPPATVYLLTSAIASALLPTVRSRCMRLRVGRLTEREVAEILVRDYDMPEQDARTAAALSDGRVGEALALGSSDVAVLREAALLLLRQAATNAAVAARLQAAGVLTSGPARKERPREEVGLVLRMLASMLRDIELLNSGADQSVLANPALVSELNAIRGRYAGARARDGFVMVDRAVAALERNVGTKVVSEWLAVQL